MWMVSQRFGNKFTSLNNALLKGDNRFMQNQNNILNNKELEPSQVANGLLKETPEKANDELAKFFIDDPLFAVNVCINLLEITKESIKGKNLNQQQFNHLCENAIDACKKAIEDRQISKEEKTEILKTVNEIIKISDESNKQYQKDNKEITMNVIKTSGVVVSVLGVLSIIATAITKSIKK